MQEDRIPTVFSRFCFFPDLEDKKCDTTNSEYDKPIVLEKITCFDDELRRGRESLRITEERSQCRDHLHHEECHTGRHTDDEHDRVGHRTLDLAGDRVDLLCLISDLYKCLVELTSSFSGFDE